MDNGDISPFFCIVCFRWCEEFNVNSDYTRSLSTFDGLLGLTKINTKFPFLKKLVEVNIGH